jgi:hypothetical protein
MTCPTPSRSIMVLAALALFVLGGSAVPVAAQGTVPGAKLRQLLAKLNDTIDMKDFQAPLTLKEALSMISDKMRAKYKDDDALPILVNLEAFKPEPADSGEQIYDTQVKFPSFPRRMSVATAIKVALSQVVATKATFLVRDQYVEITSVNEASLHRLLQQKVFAAFERRPFAEAVEELSAPSGVTVMLDPRLADKLKTPVTATLNHDISLEGALRLITDTVGAKVYVSEDGVYITSAANAEALEKDRKRRFEQRGAAEPAPACP